MNPNNGLVFIGAETDLHVAPVGYNTMNRVQPKSSSLPHLLGGEERVEDSFLDIRRYSLAIVNDVHRQMPVLHVGPNK